MAVIVQKFGGTSTASERGWQALAQKVKVEIEQGNSPIVVVSAMGRRPAPYATDSLLGLVAPYQTSGSARERDMLMACGEVISAVVVSHYLRSQGLEAQAFDGPEAGILAGNSYGQASIISIDPSNLLKALQEGKIPVVAGFQGINEQGEVVTLGRGGSDTTAVALGAAVGADRVDIFTDVEGVMTADPRCVPQAKVLDKISHSEVGEMANEGAKVLHPRAVEISQSHSVPLRVRSTFSDAPGTSIEAMGEGVEDEASNLVKQVVNGVAEGYATCLTMENAGAETDPAGTNVKIDDRRLSSERVVTGIVSVPGYAMVSIDFQAAADLRNYRLELFDELAKASLSLDMINVAGDKVTFLINNSDLNVAKKLLEKFGCSFSMLLGCAKLSVVGQAMRGQPGVMLRICKALADGGADFYYSTDSHITISVVVPESSLEVAARAVHREFGLG